MGVQYSVHFIQNNDDKSGIRYGGGEKYKGKGGYSAEGLEQRVTYIIKNMFMNYRVKKIAKTKLIHMKNRYFFTDITCITI